MKAAIMRTPGKPLTIEDIDIAEPGAGEVKVRVTATGICHTDITVFHGGLPVPLPIVLGHEGVGVVENVGNNVKTLKPGDKVLINALVYCGECSDCAKGPLSACPRNFSLMFGGAMRDGTTRLNKGKEVIHSFFCQSSFAEYCITHEDFAIKVPDSISVEKLVALCCGGATGIGAVFNKAKVYPGSTVAVLGCGGVGISGIMAARLSGALKIIAVDVKDEKLKFAESFGATHFVNASTKNPVEAVRSLSNGGVDFAIEAVGNGETIAQSLDMLKPGGKAVVIGAVPFGIKAPIDPIQLLAEKTIAGSTIGTLKPQSDIPRYIELFQSGHLPVDRLIQAEYPLEKINEAISAIEKGDSIKAIIKFY
jgi:S-(hydroxymethyl)glutathione dehydrogenase / alcohol dehydrogenase